jgi:hypothetical protein
MDCNRLRPAAPVLPPLGQVDGGVYGTPTRKFLTCVPAALFLLATHATDLRRQPLALNLGAVLLLTAAKLPALHKVRLFGINKY